MAFAATNQGPVKQGASLSNSTHDNATVIHNVQVAAHVHNDSGTGEQALMIPTVRTKELAYRLTKVKAAKTTASKSATPVRHTSKPASHPSGPVHHVKVTAGETLWGIASAYGVSVSNLSSWNHIRSGSTLHLGQVLVIYGGKTPSKSSSSNSSLSGRSEDMSSSLSSAVFGEQVVAYARNFLGVPYVWGGESVHGFDCSGFVQFTFSHMGVSLPRDSYSQFDVGTSISRSDLMPGDLVFFDTDGGGASHVGIYVGGGKFIDASGSQVQINSLYTSYWGSHYIGARRVHS